MIKYVLTVVLSGLLISCGSINKDPDYSWIIPSVDFDRRDFPVSIKLPAELEIEDRKPVLKEVSGDELLSVVCQLKIYEGAEISWVVEGLTKAGEERSYQLSFSSVKGEDTPMKTEKNDSTLIISKGPNQILHYRHSDLPAPEGTTYLYDRSGFIHPLYSPSGETLTWVQPPDHIHHMGLWNPWTKVSWKGNHTDFWNLASGLGTVRYKDVISTVSGPVFAEIHVLHDHIAFVPGKTPNPDDNEECKDVIVMEEEWIIRVWNIEDGYLLDFTSLIRNVLDESISLDAYRYGGGIGYRASEKWNKDNSAILTSEGKIRKDGDATRARWCMMYGDLEGISTAVLFMSDTENFDYPQPMRIWPENSNGVGHQFFEFTPIREKAWILEPGKTYSQNYRIWVKEGDLDSTSAEQQWLQYIEGMDQNISYLSR